jgi:hypothetical protein
MTAGSGAPSVHGEPRSGDAGLPLEVGAGTEVAAVPHRAREHRVGTGVETLAGWGGGGPDGRGALPGLGAEGRPGGRGA